MVSNTGIGASALAAIFFSGIVAAELPATVEGSASEGLIQIATTGNPEGLNAELGGEITSSALLRRLLAKRH